MIAHNTIVATFFLMRIHANHLESPPITPQSPQKIATNHLPITSFKSATWRGAKSKSPPQGLVISSKSSHLFRGFFRVVAQKGQAFRLNAQPFWFANQKGQAFRLNAQPFRFANRMGSEPQKVVTFLVGFFPTKKVRRSG